MSNHVDFGKIREEGAKEPCYYLSVVGWVCVCMSFVLSRTGKAKNVPFCKNCGGWGKDPIPWQEIE